MACGQRLHLAPAVRRCGPRARPIAGRAAAPAAAPRAGRGEPTPAPPAIISAVNCSAASPSSAAQVARSSGAENCGITGMPVTVIFSRGTPRSASRKATSSLATQYRSTCGCTHRACTSKSVTWTQIGGSARALARLLPRQQLRRQEVGAENRVRLQPRDLLAQLARVEFLDRALEIADQRIARRPVTLRIEVRPQLRQSLDQLDVLLAIELAEFLAPG